MRIVSVNAEKTIDDYHIAFNVDAAPAEGLMAHAKHGGLTVRFEDGVLIVRAPRGADAPRITAKTVANMNERFAASEAEMADEEKRQAVERAKMLDRVQKSTGLDIA